jgi:hypothetical protein
MVNLVSCSYFNKETKVDTRKPIAKVNTVFLYKEDVKAILPENYKPKDSALLVANYINSWAKKQLLLSKARLNLTDDALELEKLVQKYREDLLINKYREAVITQNLDTIVSEADIDTFYVHNKDILKLNEDLLKLKFIQVDKNIIDRKKIEKLFKSDNREDIAILIDKELEFKSFYFNDSIWIKYTDVHNKIPLLEKKEINNIKKNTYLVKEDSLNLYLINIKEVLKRNSISPKSYVLPTIKQMILHTRKLKLLKEIETTLLNDANKNGQYEIYK